MTEKARRFYVVQNGGTLPWQIKDHFMRGLPHEGMYVDMIFFMYGEPNFKSVLERDNDGNIVEYKWTYYNQDRENGWNLKIILELIFDENHNVKTVLFDRECEILDNCNEIINY